MTKREYSGIEQMVASANKESDRGCALILSANLDNRLSELLRNLCVKEPPKSQKDLFSKSNFPSTFSSRIDMCYALGQIGEEEYRDMNLIRKIRNEFAHHEDGLSFETAEIRQRCFAFGLVKEMEDDYPSPEHQIPEPRNRFQLLVASLCIMIDQRSKIALENRPIVRESNSILPKPKDI